MIVGGFSSTGIPVRPSAGEREAVPTQPEAKLPSRETLHFRQISTISHGSLSAAYQAIRAQEAGMTPSAAGGATAILSASGIPAALAAYGEMSGEE